MIHIIFTRSNKNHNRMCKFRLKSPTKNQESRVLRGREERASAFSTLDRVSNRIEGKSKIRRDHRHREVSHLHRDVTNEDHPDRNVSREDHLLRRRLSILRVIRGVNSKDQDTIKTNNNNLHLDGSVSSQGPSHPLQEIRDLRNQSGSHLPKGPHPEDSHLHKGPRLADSHLLKGPRLLDSHLLKGPRLEDSHLPKGPRLEDSLHPKETHQEDSPHPKGTLQGDSQCASHLQSRLLREASNLGSLFHSNLNRDHKIHFIRHRLSGGRQHMAHKAIQILNTRTRNPNLQPG